MLPTVTVQELSSNKFNEMFWPFFILTFFFWIDLGIIPSIPDILFVQLKLNNLTFGLLGASTFLVAGLTSPFVFKLMISQNIKYLVMLAILIFILCQCLFALIPNIFLRFSMRFLIGLSYSIVWSIQRVRVRVMPTQQYNNRVWLIFLAQVSGFFSGFLLGYLFQDLKSVYLLSGCLCFLPFLIFLFLKSDFLDMKYIKSILQRQLIYKKGFLVECDSPNRRFSTENFSFTEQRKLQIKTSLLGVGDSQVSIFCYFTTVLKKKIFSFSLAMVITQQITVSSILFWLNYILKEYMAMSPQQSFFSCIYSIFCSLPVGYSIGYLILYIGNHNVRQKVFSFIISFSQFIILAGVMTTYFFLPKIDSQTFSLIIFTILFVQSLTQPLLITYCYLQIPQYLRSVSTLVQLSCENIFGYALGIFLIGVITQIVGTSQGFLVICFMALINTSISFIYCKLSSFNNLNLQNENKQNQTNHLLKNSREEDYNFFAQEFQEQENQNLEQDTKEPQTNKINYNSIVFSSQDNSMYNFSFCKENQSSQITQSIHSNEQSSQILNSNSESTTFQYKHNKSQKKISNNNNLQQQNQPNQQNSPNQQNQQNQ